MPVAHLTDVVVARLKTPGMYFDETTPVRRSRRKEPQDLDSSSAARSASVRASPLVRETPEWGRHPSGGGALEDGRP
jgi:hypothetical protein